MNQSDTAIVEKRWATSALILAVGLAFAAASYGIATMATAFHWGERAPVQQEAK